MIAINQSLASRTTLLKPLPLSLEELTQAGIANNVDQTLPPWKSRPAQPDKPLDRHATLAMTTTENKFAGKQHLS